MQKRVKLIVVQLGSPANTSVKAVRRFLKDFLGDPRVVGVPRLIWWFILRFFILPLRPYKSAKAYRRIWEKKGFPLVFHTQSFARKLGHLYQKEQRAVSVEYAFVNGIPSVAQAIGCPEMDQEIILLPQYPQYSETTTASVYDRMSTAIQGLVNIPSLSVDASFHRTNAFIETSVAHIENSLAGKAVDELVISFHGVPLSQIAKGDIYLQHCVETFCLLQERLSIDESRIHLCFQSRFGPASWTAPATDNTVIELAKKGAKSIAVYCPSFTVDCLETIDEIGHELQVEVEEYSTKIHLVSCLNDRDDWVHAYKDYLDQKYFGRVSQQDSELKVDTERYQKALAKTNGEKLVGKKAMQTKMNSQSKSTLKLIFLTLFLDLVGFSIIFPMFPALAKHYLEIDRDNYFLRLIFGAIENITQAGGVEMNSIVLFGGALGALYSVLQFIAAPLWGGISDRVGRRPVLLISIFGLFASYMLWFFSGNFTLLVLARFVGGIMGGNLSVATAAVADVTDGANRSKGMAIVGIAFALGFILGPAIGGALSLIDLTYYYPTLTQYGVNPFSMPAAFAALLGLINLLSVTFYFKETLNQENREITYRSANIFELLKPSFGPSVNRVNLCYFLFICAFSGMEFTLTFLAVERLKYTSMDNAYMFIFIGLIMILVQGGYVRRKAHQVGEKKMAQRGLSILIPGLVILAFMQSSFALYLGLAFLAVGSSMTVPTLTSLVSLLLPKNEQGRGLGVFRSLGSLGRVFGPLVASLLYWKFGSQNPYLLGAITMLLPLLILTGVSPGQTLET